MKVSDILEFYRKNQVAFSFVGEEDLELDGFSSFGNYRDGSFSWVRNPETIEKQQQDGSRHYRCLIGPPSIEGLLSCDALVLVEIDPKKAFFDILSAFYGENKAPVISAAATIEEGARIGKNVRIGANSFISAESVIADNCWIGENCVLQGKVVLGENCYVSPGAVLGAEGFAFETNRDSVTHFGHFGGVRLGRDVFIGANCCVCRGAIDDTTIDDYVKINSLCHIAHNVVIGKRTIITAGTVIMGSVRIGTDCWISTATIRDQRTIGNRVQVGSGSVVTKDVPDDTTVVGIPAKPHVKNNYQNDVNNRK